MPYALKPAGLLAAWQQYKKKCDEHTIEQRYRNEILTIKKPKIYLMEVFCCLAGLDEEDVDKLRKNRNYKKVFSQIEYAVLARKLDALVNGEGSASGLIFDLKANHGIHVKKAEKAMKDKVWDVTLDLGNGHIKRFVNGEEQSVGQKVNKSSREEDDADSENFEWNSNGGFSRVSAENVDVGEGQQEHKMVEAAVAEEPQNVVVKDPAAGETIIITKQPQVKTPLENDRMVEVYRTDPFTGETFTLNMWLSQLSDKEREKYDPKPGWMPYGTYSVW